MDKENRLNEIKEVVKKKIDNLSEERIAQMYDMFIGCVDCEFQFTCDKRRPCYQSIIKYIKKGTII